MLAVLFVFTGLSLSQEQWMILSYLDYSCTIVPVILLSIRLSVSVLGSHGISYSLSQSALHIVQYFIEWTRFILYFLDQSAPTTKY